MAVTSSFPFKSVVYHHTTTTATPSPPTPSISSFESRLFGIRLCNPNFTRHDFFISLSPAAITTTTFHSSITARFGGGGGGYRPGGGGGGSRSGYDSRQSRQSGGEDDQALDISSIRSVMVRLIDEHQNMVGVVSKSEAMRMAEDAELDLVILSPEADPPVLRIMDYNKYKYELQKKKRDQQKKNAANRMDLKELKMGYNIDSHDYSVRLKAAQKFLKDGDKVKIIVNLKGRENEFRNIAIELIKRFQNDIGELATEESKSFRERNMNIVLVPNKLLLQKSQDPVKKKEKSPVSGVSAGL